MNYEKHFLIITFIIIVACSTTKTTQSVTSKEENKAGNDIYLINDIWLLETINGTAINKAGEGNKTPQLEIHVKDMRALGNDGCNQISGGLKTLNEKNITFGMMMSTRMMCPDMRTSAQFLKAIEQVTHHKIEKLKLYLFDASGTELLQFKKID